MIWGRQNELLLKTELCYLGGGGGGRRCTAVLYAEKNWFKVSA